MPLGKIAPRALECYSFGHTGFTGTAIWIDLEKEIGAILLTGRVHPSRTERRLLDMRDEFYRLSTVIGE